MSGSDDQFKVDYQNLLTVSSDLQTRHDTDVGTVSVAINNINQAIAKVAAYAPSFSSHATSETNLIHTHANDFLGKYKALADQIEQTANDAMSTHQHIARLERYQ